MSCPSTMDGARVWAHLLRDEPGWLGVQRVSWGTRRHWRLVRVLVPTRVSSCPDYGSSLLTGPSAPAFPPCPSCRQLSGASCLMSSVIPRLPLPLWSQLLDCPQLLGVRNRWHLFCPLGFPQALWPFEKRPHSGEAWTRWQPFPAPAACILFNGLPFTIPLPRRFT